jgi:hypothetical protein
MSRCFRRKTITVASRVQFSFCLHGTNFIEHYACRDTMLNGASKLSRYTKHYCGQMRVSGCKNHYKSVLRAGTKAKSVTNNLPILSVLAVGTVKSVGLSKDSIVFVQQSFKLYCFVILIVGINGYLSFIHRIENPTFLPTPIGTKEVCMQFKLPSDELHHEQ